MFKIESKNINYTIDDENKCFDRFISLLAKEPDCKVRICLNTSDIEKGLLEFTLKILRKHLSYCKNEGLIKRSGIYKTKNGYNIIITKKRITTERDMRFLIYPFRLRRIIGYTIKDVYKNVNQLGLINFLYNDGYIMNTIHSILGIIVSFQVGWINFNFPKESNEELTVIRHISYNSILKFINNNMITLYLRIRNIEKIEAL
jgi:hypothetical protein